MKSAPTKKPVITTKPAAKKPATKPAAKPAAAKPAAAKPAAKPAAAKPAAKPAAAKPAAAKPAAKPAAAKPAGAKAPATKIAPRADYGKPVDGFFAKQPPHLRPITDTLRALIAEVAPAATATIKWGMPVYEVAGTMMVALNAHKAHVNLILSGPPGTYADPDGRLEGDGKSGRRLRLTSVDQLPRDQVRAWLRTAAARAS